MSTMLFSLFMGIMCSVAYLSGRFSGKKAVITTDVEMLFTDEYYKQVKYFKLDYANIYAIKKDGTKDEIHSSTSTTAEKYFIKIQTGYENWLSKQRPTQEEPETDTPKSSKSKISF